MLVDPLILKIAGWLLALLITIVGYFINRMFKNQERRNGQQDKTNLMLQQSIEELNKTMATVVEGFKWFQNGCAERHSQLGLKQKTKAA